MRFPPVLLAYIIPIALGTIATAAFGAWVSFRPDLRIEQRLPGQDGFVASAVEAATTDLKGTLVAGNATVPELPGAWPRFRGPDLNAISTDPTPLTRSFASPHLPALWSIEVGEGYAGAAVRDGRIYFIDYDAKAKADVIRCLALATGQEVWRRSYAVEISRNHGITRTVPALDGKYLVTLGPKCHVVCLDATTGEFVWGIDLVKQYGTTVPQWYAGQCPLIDDGKVVLAPGGESLLVAVDLATGEVAWKTPNPRKWLMTHSSVVPMKLGGVKQYVYCATGGVVGVSAHDGKGLWDYPGWKVTMANVPSPVQLSESRIFLSGGYGAGSMILGLATDGPKEIVRLKPEVFGAEQHTPVLFEGHLYGVIPGGQLVCLDLEGKRKWASGKTRFGLGPYMIADGIIIAMNDSGLLGLVEAKPDGFKLVAQARVFEEGHEAWGPFALAGGRLVARDLTRMVCIDLRKQPQ